MKTFLFIIAFITLNLNLMAQTNPPATTQTEKLTSAVYDWEKMKPVTVPNGIRRTVFDGPTATLDKLHCHITVLNPGEVSSEPHLHLQEEVIIIREGTVEAYFDGETALAGPGSVIFFKSHAVTRLRNPGKVPAIYTVVNYYTPLTPKS
jgi:uncharacterized cupin superfamily protein